MSSGAEKYDPTDLLEAVEEIVHLIPLVNVLSADGSTLTKQPPLGKCRSIYMDILWDKAERLGKLLAEHPGGNGDYQWAANGFGPDQKDAEDDEAEGDTILVLGDVDDGPIESDNE